MPAPEFDQISKAGRDKLARLLGGPDLALRFWDEVIRPRVDGAEEWGLRPGYETAKGSRLRYGKKLQAHMEKVSTRAKELSALLDDDTLQRVSLPPVDLQGIDDIRARRRTDVQRILELRRLLDEIASEIEIPRVDFATGRRKNLADWSEMERPVPFRLDCYLAAAVFNLVSASPSIKASPDAVLSVVFVELGIGGPEAVYTAAGSIRDAKARKLIP